MKPKHDWSKPRSRPNHDLKPTGANPFKKIHHRSHLSHNPTTTTTHFNRRSTTNNPLQPPIHDQRPTSSQLADPRPRSNHADPQPTTHNHANPQPTTHNHADPQPPLTHNHADPQPTTHNPQRTQPRPTTPFKLRAQPKTITREGRERRDGVWVRREERAEMEKQRREGRERKELRKETVGIKYIYIYFLTFCYSAILSVELYCSTIAKIFAIVRFSIVWCKCFWTLKCQKCLKYSISIFQC